jgi:exonuclease SbcC
LQELEFKRNNLKERRQQLSQEIQARRMRIGTIGHAQVDFTEKPRRTWTYLTSTAALGTATILSLFFPIAFPATLAFGSLTAIFLLLLARQIATLSANAQVSETKQEQLAGVKLVESIEQQLTDLDTSYTSTNQKLQEQSEELLNKLASITRYKTIVESSTDPKTAVDQVTSTFNRDKQLLTALEERASTLQRTLQEETGLRERLSETVDEVRRVNQKLASTELPALPQGTIFSDDLLLETSDYRDNLRDSVSRVKTQLEDIASQIIELRHVLEENRDLQGQVEDQKKNVGLLEKELAVVKYSIKGLDNTAESLRNRVKPQVERYMGVILPLITSGHYKAVQMDEDYTVQVFDPEAGEFKPKEVFSGGTEDQLLLAMRLAFALSLTPQTKGRNPEFLFLDEPLGSSDKVRREGIVQLLRKELSQSFKQIFLISHVGDLEIEADAVITMENGTVREITGRTPALMQRVEELTA